MSEEAKVEKAEEKKAEHIVKVHMKSVQYENRMGHQYRPGSVQYLQASEAYDLATAGIASIEEDPWSPPAPPPVPYLEPEVVEGSPVGTSEDGQVIPFPPGSGDMEDEPDEEEVEEKE